MPMTLINQAVQTAAQQTAQSLAADGAPARTVSPAQAAVLRDNLHAARLELGRQDGVLKAFHAAITSLLGQLETARRSGDTAQAQAIEASLQAENAGRGGAVVARQAALQAVLARQAELVGALGTAAAYHHLDPQTPVALLPVRLETRWFALDATRYELRVRMFPDDIHIDQHQRDPSAAELDLARSYWTTRLAQGPDADATTQAWEVICRRHGEARATWLAARLDPFQRAGRFEPDDAGSTPEPALPQPAAAPDGWQDTPAARALPDRWAVVGYAQGSRVLAAWSGAVSPELPMTPALGAPGSEQPGIEDPLAPDEGLRWLTDFAAAEAAGMALRIPVAKIVARVLDKLVVFGVAASLPPALSAAALDDLFEAHAATSLGFVPHGAPSNNTEMLKSAYRSREPDHVQAHDRLIGNEPAGRPGSQQERIARALGISPEPFRHAWGADHSRENEVRAMHAALWPTSVGGLLRQVMDVPVTQPAVDLAREQFVRHLRAEGPLPTLRIDAQPYGLLPVVSLARWRAAAPSVENTVFVNGLRSLHAYWERGHHTGSHAALPQVSGRGLNAVLTSGPTGSLTEGKYTQADASQGANPFNAFWPPFVALLKNGTADLTAAHGGLKIEQRNGFFSNEYLDLGCPPVSPQEDPSRPLDANYIQALAELAAAGNTAAVQAHEVTGAAPRSLLYLLLRSACLECLGAIAAGAPAAERQALVEALRQLAGLPVASLESLLIEINDACGHRLDAWITSVASARLAEVRTVRPGGVHLGAYGWLEGLDPPGEGLPQGSAPVTLPDNAGYIHMPSLPQARTAALLHGAYLANTEPGAADLFAINLGAGRVRAARQLLDGMAHGRTLNALLGYRLERLLTETGQSALIPALRALAPSPAGSGGVADGLALQQRWKANPTDAALPAAARPVLADLDAALDALGDLLLAEGVHQTANGNPVRAAAAFDALADGTALATEPEVVQTPVSGRSFTQRVALLLPATPAPGWSGDDARLRALAEPRLNGWAAALLGAPEHTSFRARLVDQQGFATERDFTLAEFDLCPLDVVAMAGEPLVELIRHHLQRRGSVDVTIHTGGGSGPRRLEETLSVAQAIARVIGAGRPLAEADLAAEVAVQAAETDIELGERAQALQGGFDALWEDINATTADADVAWRASVLVGPVDPAAPDAGAALRAELAVRLARAQSAQTDAVRIAALLGQGFRPMPLFTPANAAAWTRVFTEQSSLTGNDPLEPRRWLNDYARVRGAVESLDTLLTLQDAMGTPPALAALAVAHLPWQPGQAWVGRRTPEGIAAQLSLIAHAPFGARLDGGIAGLMLDSWAETVPEPRALTGVAFHYDEPKAQAPQAVLLALPPDPTRGWLFDDLEATLLETLEVAKTRGVGPEHVRDDDDVGVELASYLPALYVFDDARSDLKAA